MPQVYGAPAKHASMLAREHGIKFVTCSIASAVSVVVLVLFALPALAEMLSTFASIVAWLLVAEAVAAGCYGRYFYVRMQRARAGALSERLVAKKLTKMPIRAVVHGAKLAHGDADHVVLGPMAAVLETKTAHGTFKVKGDQIFAGSKNLTSASRQVKDQARKLEKMLRVQVASAVVVPKATGSVFFNDVWYTGLDGLETVLKKFPHVVSASIAESTAASMPLAK